MSNAKVEIKEKHHLRIAGGPDQYCGWPVMGGIHNFGAGEITVTFVQGTSAYRTSGDLDHYTIESRSKVMLRRSPDHGETWPEDLAVEVFDNSVPLDDIVPDSKIERAPIDMSKPESILYAGRSMVTKSRVVDSVRIPRERYPVRPIPFVVRSADKGYTWEQIPILIPLYHLDSGYGFSQYVVMADGSILLGLPGTTGPDYNKYAARSELYRSTDNGESWYWANTLFSDPFNETNCSYPNPRLLPSGRLACTLGFWKDPRNRVRWMGIIYSDDGGINWTEPRRIGWWGISPFPLVLRDGRLLLIYAWRQSEPYGIRGMISEDEGKTWSDEFILRDDAASPDLGYPVATERDDGKIFTAYYYNVHEEPFLVGGPRHIAASIFTLG
jgi:hypothetical protein